KRQDLIPSLIETVRIYVKDQQKILDQLIAERAVAAKEHIADASKIEYEHDLSSTLNKVFDFSTVSKDLSVDTNFLELKGEIRQVERDIEFKVRQYNDTVRYYNKHRNIFFLWPIAKIFGYKPENVFEVEM
ncbi:LemA family protein, partial [Candidatus Peregrinibacteria bacterium]|nr:LemA family protein [Candidatus Peregrinibacteria bacterium]